MFYHSQKAFAFAALFVFTALSRADSLPGDVIEAAFDDSFALVIGIDSYPSPAWSDLNYAVSDARAFADYLSDQGFEVRTLYNEQATKEAIDYLLQDYFVDKVGDDDRFLLFFAGHGETRKFSNGTQGFIVPSNGNERVSSLVSMDHIRTMSARMTDSRHQLFIMDACYGGLLAEYRGVGVVSQSHPEYLSEITRRRARQILTAGGADQRVIDRGPGENSLFTMHLLQSLRDGEANLNGDDYITFSELAAYIVPAASSSQQTPAVSTLAGHMAGDFVFRTRQTSSDASGTARPISIVPELEPTTIGSELEKTGILRLFQAYFEANNEADVDRLLGLFDSEVDYFSWGKIRKDRIREDKEYFFKRWPDIAYTPVGEPIINVTGNTATISTTFDFYVQNKEKCDGRHGASVVELEAVERLEGWRIISVKEEINERAKFNSC